MNKFLLIIFLCSCTTAKDYWSYVVVKDIDKPMLKRKKGKLDTPKILANDKVKIIYNDGSIATEIYIPILSSGQKIYIAQNESKVKELNVVPSVKTAADKDIVDNYIKKGGVVKKGKIEVSIIGEHIKIKKYFESGNYLLALKHVELILSNYPRHLKTLRAKGSLLLKIGEKETALEVYKKAQDIEYSSEVNIIVKKLEKK